jgi:acyl-CoA synthetase (AMP-forming)/AMP-acid ligase II
VARPGCDIDPAEVIAWSREQMANFKVPRAVHVVQSLPVNASGKVLKFELRGQATP